MSDKAAGATYRPARAGTPSPVLDSDFVCLMLHKISQPLAAARGSLEMALLFGRNKEDYREAVVEAIAHIDHLTHMKQTIAELASTEDLMTGAERVSIIPALVAAKEVVESQAEVAGVRLQLTPASSDSLFAIVNSMRVTQALVGFLTMAVGYSPSGSTLEIKCVAGGEWLALSIVNAQGSIPEKDLPRLFDAFVELSAKGVESGANMALSRRIIEASGGSVRSENLGAAGAEATGFRFCLRLPATESASKSSAA